MAKTVKISSTTWKQIDDVLRGRDINVGFALGGGREQLSVAAARNVGSVGIDKNDVVSLTGVLIDSASPAFFEGKYGFTCTDTLSSPDKPCGVALEPIVAGAIGKVAVFGHVAVRVNVTDSSHEFATASETTAGQLVSAESGSFRLVWKSASSGLVWAVAIFPYATGGGSRAVQYAVVTQVPAYNDPLKNKFVVQKASVDTDNQSETYNKWVGDGVDIAIERALGFEGHVKHEGSLDAMDIRNWYPWPPVGSVVPIIEKWDYEQAVPALRWYMDIDMVYGGKESDSSIRVDDETVISLAMSA